MKVSEYQPEKEASEYNRRSFIGRGLKLALMSSIAGSVLLPGCRRETESREKAVSPPEDLMQEHGVLNRILLIYETCKARLINKESFPIMVLTSAAGIVRSFVEDYHEKQEENYLFPRFKRADQLTGLVDILLAQHRAGRDLTDQILQFSKPARPSGSEREKLIRLITAFNAMYRPHEAREDTVLFPAFRKIVSRHEYDSLGEEFEKNEHQLFGSDGFETVVEQVAEIERSLGIYDLSQFTPSDPI